jgi:hypothetical protein
MTYPHDPTTSIRASALTLAEHCPGSWRLRALAGESKPTVEMEHGTEVHAELAAEKPTYRALVFREALIRRLGADPLSARYEVAGTLTLGGGLQITGTVDLLVFDATTLEPIVVDYKTGAGFHLPPMEHDLQMLAYSAMHRFARVVRVQVGEEDGAFTVLRADDIEIIDPVGFFARIATAAREALAPRAPLLPGGHCSMCRVRDACPAQQVLAENFRRVGCISTELAARTVALGLAATEREAKKLKAELQAWVDEHGAVRDGARAWGARSTQVERLDDFAPSIFRFVAARVGHEAALACISITGASLERGLSVSLLDVEAIRRIRGELRAAGLTTETTSTKWGWHKLKPSTPDAEGEEP